MKRIVFVLAAIPLLVFSIGAQPQQPAPDLSWAFAVTNGALPAEEPGPKNVPGSTKSYTQAQIEDLSNPPDWFPDEHTPAPQIVKYGHGDALACGACHLMSGQGHPESANLAGFPAAYIMKQLQDFRSGVRKEPLRMNSIAMAMTDEELRQASEWFSQLKPSVWTKVVEAPTVPKTFVGGGRMRYVLAAGGTEPIGNRIITVPEDQSRVTKRDPHSGFIAYAPPGSLAKGEALVKNGGNGRTIACITCHGDSLTGIGNVPRIAGLHPAYIARQLYIIKDGRRNGVDTQLMKKPVEKLTDEDIVNIAAYLGSLSPMK